MEDFQVENFSQNSPNHLRLSSISWSKASVNISPEFKKQHKTQAVSSPGQGLHLEIDKMSGGNTALKIISSKVNAEVILERIASNKIEWEPNKKPVINDLSVKGKSIFVKNQKLDLASGQFSIEDMQPSFINRLKILSINKKDTISINSPQLVFTPNIASIISGKTEINDVSLINPEFRINPTGDSTSAASSPKNNGKLPSLSINQLSILNPVLVNLPSSLSKTFNASEHKSEWHISDISVDSNRLSIGGLKSSVQGFSAETKNLHVSVKGEGKLNLDIGAVQFSPGK